jgi:hypothetical protein
MKLGRVTIRGTSEQILAFAPYTQAATAFAQLGSPAFARTPDLFLNLMAATIQRQDISQWAAERGVVTSGHA